MFCLLCLPRVGCIQTRASTMPMQFKIARVKASLVKIFVSNYCAVSGCNGQVGWPCHQHEAHCPTDTTTVFTFL